MRTISGTAATVVATVAALALSATVPATAIVRFEPSKEPTPERWEAIVPVTVEWADVSMRFPEAWTAKPKRAPVDEGGGASLLYASGPGGSMCLLDRYRTASIETWQDVGVSASEELTIDGHETERFDDMLGMGAPVASAYSIDAGELQYGLLCSADQAPVDRWLSIAETITIP